MNLRSFTLRRGAAILTLSLALVLAAYLAASALARDRADASPNRRLFLIGLALGSSLLLDYSAMPLCIAFGLWVIAQGWQRQGPAHGLRWGVRYVAGAAGPIALLLGYPIASGEHDAPLASPHGRTRRNRADRPVPAGSR